jgi:hypothetical protein
MTRPAATPRPVPRQRPPVPPPWPAPKASGLSPDQTLARAGRLGHHIDRLPVASGGPIQCGGLGCGFWGCRKRTRARSSSSNESIGGDAAAPLAASLFGSYGLQPASPHPPHNSSWPGVDNDAPITGVHHEAAGTSNADDATTAASVASGLGSGASFASRMVDADLSQRLTGGVSTPSSVVPGLGVGTGALSAVGSSVDAYLKLRRLFGGTQRAGDKVQMGLEASSSLANATVSGASATTNAGQLMGSSLGSSAAAGAAHVIPPAAMAMGAADVIAGSADAIRGASRQKGLEAIGRQAGTSSTDQGIASFAAESQRTKKWSGVATALKGGLAIGGGIALLLGAGPVGWGLLGGAAAVAGGTVLAKKIRKHYLGKKLAPDQEMGRNLTGEGHFQLASEADFARQSWLKRFNTKAGRTHDLMRGQIADHLAEHTVTTPFDAENVRAPAGRAQEIAGLLGFDPIRQDGGIPADAKKLKRTRRRDLARALAGD